MALQLANNFRFRRPFGRIGKIIDISAFAGDSTALL